MTEYGQLSSIKINSSSNPILDCWSYFLYGQSSLIGSKIVFNSRYD